jgi:WD40 repeat protein
VYACDLCPTDADLAVSGGGDDRALLWRLSTGNVVHTLGGTSRPLAWPLPIHGSPLRLFPGHTDSVSAVTFSSDGRLVAAGGMDGRVHVWDVQSGALSGALEGPDEVMVRGACAHTHTHTLRMGCSPRTQSTASGWHGTPKATWCWQAAMTGVRGCGAPRAH